MRISPALRRSSGLSFVLVCAPLPLASAGCSPGPSPTVNVPITSATASAAPATAMTRPAGPIVLFAVVDGLLAPVVCHDGKEPLPPDSSDCMALAPEGAKVALDKGGTATLGEAGEAPCRGSQVNNFEGRKAASAALGEATHAVWPEGAAGAVKRLPAELKATDKEIAAMVALLVKEGDGMFETPPTLAVTGGLAVDIDGDGAADRVFAAHNEARMFGVVAGFLSTAPAQAVDLAVMSHDYPELIGVTELDGRPGHEVWIAGEFVEGIDDRTVSSAIYERVVAFRKGKGEELGSWGCRMF